MTRQAQFNALLKSIRRITRAVDIASKQLEREFGLTLPQLIVLRCVHDLGEVTSRVISAEADLSAPTVVGILDKLEAKGMIERYRSTLDRRIVHTRLTMAGQQLLAQEPAPLGREFTRAFRRIDTDTRDRMVDALAAVANLISEKDASTKSGQKV